MSNKQVILGKVCLTPRGHYTATETYHALDIITYNGNSYLVLQEFSNIEPIGDNIYTIVLASKGDRGKPFQFSDFTEDQLASLQGEKGDPGDALLIKGYFDSLEELETAINEPLPGDTYGIGENEPYEIFIYDGVSASWKNNGTLSGPAGISAYQSYQQAGGELSEEEFNMALATIQNKINLEEGKGLSTEDYTTTEKEKLSTLPIRFNVSSPFVTASGEVTVEEVQAFVTAWQAGQEMYYPGFRFGQLEVEEDTENLFSARYTVVDLRNKLSVNTITLEVVDETVNLFSSPEHYLTTSGIKGSSGIKVSCSDDNTITLENNNELFRIVTVLPEKGEENLFYLLVNPADETGNLYDEYIWIANNWEKVGSRSIDLSGYMTLDTNQEITGTKNFSGDLKVKGNKVWHTGNQGSGSGLDADKLDGYDFPTSPADYYRNFTKMWRTITINGDYNTFYPVHVKFDDNDNRMLYHMGIGKELHTLSNSNWAGNHSGGTSSMSAHYLFRMNGWDGNGNSLITLKNTQSYARLLARTLVGNGSMRGFVFWLRGGKAVYNLFTDAKFSSVDVYDEITPDEKVDVGMTGFPINVQSIALENINEYNNGWAALGGELCVTSIRNELGERVAFANQTPQFGTYTTITGVGQVHNLSSYNYDIRFTYTSAGTTANPPTFTGGINGGEYIFSFINNGTGNLIVNLPLNVANHQVRPEGITQLIIKAGSAEELFVRCIDNKYLIRV